MQALKTLGGTALVLATLAGGAAAEEATLRAVSAFKEGSFFSQRFEEFVERVNSQGEGVLKIEYVGGPSAVPPLEIGNALRSGVVDLANTTGVFHSNLVPEATALTLVEVGMDELRENGGYEYINRLHHEKANIHYLGRVTEGIEYHIYTRKEVPAPDLSGVKLRSVPVYQSFFEALGATPVQMPPGEVYTALERGVVDGYGWPATGIFDLGWQEQTKFRVDPGFFNVEVGLFMNLDAWNELTDEQKGFLEEQVAWLEADEQNYAEAAEAAKQEQEEFGIKAITLTDAEAETYRDQAREAGWAGIERVSPDHAAKLREFFAKAE